MARIVFLLCLSFCCFAQTPNSQTLIKAHNVDNVSTMNNISNPQKGHLIFVESTSTLYFYDGSTWVSTISSGGGGTADGDAWGVSGEDLNNPISRSGGDITIGESGSTSEKLLVNGSAQITLLRVRHNLRSLVHFDVGTFDDGTIASDQFSRYYNGTPETGASTSYTFLNSINKGIFITGHYESQTGCSSNPTAIGHFQFRYYHNTNTFELVYNTGSATFSNVSGITGYQLSSTHCGNEAGVIFKANSSNEFEVKAIDGAASYNLNIKLEGY